MAWAAGAGRAAVDVAVNAARRAQAPGEIAGRAWYALAVAAQAEFLTVRLLAERGVWGFAPTRTVWRRANAMAKRKSARTFADLPGYVLVGFEGAARWDVVLGLACVRGVMGWGERPARLDVEAVDWAARRSSEAPDAWRHMRSGREFAVGDAVTVIDGAGAGLRGRVVALDGAHARVLAPFLGAERELRAALSDLALAS